MFGNFFFGGGRFACDALFKTFGINAKQLRTVCCLAFFAFCVSFLRRLRSATLRAAAVECDAYRPPVSIVLICICVNILNGFLSGEHLFKNQNTVDNVESENSETHRHAKAQSIQRFIYQTVAVQPKTE